MAVTPNSTYLYVAAATALLQQEELNPRHREDFRFGLLLANLMTNIHKSLIAQNKKMPPRRFCCYATYAVPDEYEWNKQCEKLLLLHLSTSDGKKNKAERRAAYLQVRRDLSDVLPYVDVLGGNHLVAIAGTLGLLPFWVTAEIELHKGRSVNWLLSKFFEDKKQRMKIKVDDVIANIGAALKTRFGGSFPLRMVENIVCKVFRLHTKNKMDELFCDILVAFQNLYTLDRYHVHVTSIGDNVSKTIKGSLLPMIPFRGKYISSAKLQQQLPDDWQGREPKIKNIGGRVLKGLFDKHRGEYPAHPFQLKQTKIKNKWLSNQLVLTKLRLLS
jgi:hypothetical protein